uniref:P-type sodium-transporting ATPase4 n=1 Tax=Chromera velia CCMP2878 TaxID=1169474 RepID=A0A0G4GP24_9ALVE|eukprot:Cvel_22753.t1-p1 / transcript=Cvel_22753.t1 / gene=Cvel_22753 / organism=Chromera_velia_CCMP2878 / gene_product=Sodium/potassium-transporting ATPase subunit, putative / transcript_product=Sodium/potassium-transporting ATPase subunit, putative / location=Cvel_scaffold2271:901-7250(-) / protein_length=1086 / sequence_SO=supercontig / SO=protein_coding / is_pseudo=false
MALKTGGSTSSSSAPPCKKEHLAQRVHAAAITEHSWPVEEVEKSAETSCIHGLSSKVAEERLAKDGPNMLTPPKEVPWWVHFAKHLLGGFSLLLWGGAFLCFFVFYIDTTRIPEFWLGVVLAVVVLVTGVFSWYQDSKADAVLRGFLKLTPQMASVIRDGEMERDVEATKLVRGDIVVLRGGKKVPADVLIIECQGLKVDNSSLTGEALPQRRSVEKTHDLPHETQNLAFFGTQCTEGKAKGIVIRCGDDTLMGQIATATAEGEKPETQMQIELHHFIKIITIIAGFIGVVFFVIALAIGYDPVVAVIFMIGIIVANVPEGLLVTVTVALTITAKNMAAKNVLVKNVETIETLGAVTVICSDKTGTLTQNRMTVRHAIYSHESAVGKISPMDHPGDGTPERQSTNNSATTNGPFLGRSASPGEEAPAPAQATPTISISASGPGASGGGGRRESLLASSLDMSRPALHAVHYGTKFRSPQDTTLEFGLLLRCAALCNHARFVEKKGPLMQRPTNGDASESALLKFSTSHMNVDLARKQNPEVCCVPFNSSKKFMVTIHCQPEGSHLLLMKGAPERIISRCNRLVNGTPCDEDQRRELQAAQMELAANGERVLAFAQLELPVQNFPKGFKFDVEEENFPLEGLQFIGMLSMEDPPREEVPKAVAECQSAGIQVVMVTGDHPLTAKSIATQVGIIDFEAVVTNLETSNPDATAVVVTGPEIDDLTDDQWDFILSRKQIVFARTLPQQKQRIVAEFQNRDHVVAVTGDGVNDSPALKKADVGIAMGVTGSEVAKDAADMILMDDNFASIVKGVEEGRLIFDNLKKSIVYTLESNIPEIIPFLANIMLRIPLALTTIMILAIDLGTDMLPAIAFAYETAELNIMKRKPRDRTRDRLVTLQLIGVSYLQIGMIQAFAAYTAFFWVLNDFGFQTSNLMTQQQGVTWDNPDSDPENLNTCYRFIEGGVADGGIERCAGFEYRNLALRTAQSAHFVATIVCQVAGGIIHKTRFLSQLQHNWKNAPLNVGFAEELLLCCALLYIPGMNDVFGFEPMLLEYWWPGWPFFVLTVVYDEWRKWWCRKFPKSLVYRLGFF